MKFIAAWTSILVISFYSNPLETFGQPNKAPISESEPKLKIKGPTISYETLIVDFGTVMAGKMVNDSFRFINTGSLPLEIIKVKPSCGCTVPGAWKRTIRPGGKGEIPFILNTDTFDRRISKPVTVYTNAQNKKMVQFKITGTIWQPIKVEPANFNFGLIRPKSKPKTLTAKLTNRLEEPVEIGNPQSTNASFRTELRTIRKGQQYELSVTAIPPFTYGAIQGIVSVHTSSNKKNIIYISTLGWIPEPIEFSPNKILLPPGPLAKEIIRSVIVNNHTDHPLLISDINIKGTRLNPELKEEIPGKRFRVIVTFPKDMQIIENRKLQLAFKTNSNYAQHVTIPIETRQ